MKTGTAIIPLNRLSISFGLVSAFFITWPFLLLSADVETRKSINLKDKYSKAGSVSPTIRDHFRSGTT